MGKRKRRNPRQNQGGPDDVSVGSAADAEGTAVDRGPLVPGAQAQSGQTGGSRGGGTRAVDSPWRRSRSRGVAPAAAGSDGGKKAVQ
ncbi:unnamed protein product, partial [Polarella glacialis]